MKYDKNTNFKKPKSMKQFRQRELKKGDKVIITHTRYIGKHLAVGKIMRVELATEHLILCTNRHYPHGMNFYPNEVELIKT